MTAVGRIADSKPAIQMNFRFSSTINKTNKIPYFDYVISKCTELKCQF
jgi:hypothetical protein